MKYVEAPCFSCYNQGVKRHVIKQGSLSMNLRNLFQKYKHAWVLLYAFIYLPWFIYLEDHVTAGYHIIHVALDDKIPFNEYFIIPYMMWFGFIAITILYFFFANRTEFYKLTLFLFAGMTIFLIISTIFPNGQDLRPMTFARDNMFVDMVKTLYQTDTPTNVLPSIHVFNSIGAYIAIAHNERLKNIKPIKYASFILTLAIILSTMVLKQHSIIDVIVATIMAAVLYAFVYAPTPQRASHLSKQTT